MAGIFALVHLRATKVPVCMSDIFRRRGVTAARKEIL